ncbi:hypothetical protein IQ244_19040 [Nostoc sp. LEGE 06077]|uniref:hypothetical protein n=1 Tax=Nostoc sp. LEGE 06077 TaxID=915325 RepID=UPI00187E148B|nr:hypothetical protein [Nostoc sp. LEGE 06077]MBE9208593.1 hypothetical protein [Nostoc sp. LEGE 06077]
MQEPSGFTSYGQIQQWLMSELGLALAYKIIEITPSMITSVTSYNFILEALFSASS